MFCVKIVLGDLEVGFDHVEGGVTEDILDGLDFAVITKLIDGESVAVKLGKHDISVSMPDYLHRGG